MFYGCDMQFQHALVILMRYVYLMNRHLHQRIPECRDPAPFESLCSRMKFEWYRKIGVPCVPALECYTFRCLRKWRACTSSLVLVMCASAAMPCPFTNSSQSCASLDVPRLFFRSSKSQETGYRILLRTESLCYILATRHFQTSFIVIRSLALPTPRNCALLNRGRNWPILSKYLEHPILKGIWLPHLFLYAPITVSSCTYTGLFYDHGCVDVPGHQQDSTS